MNNKNNAKVIRYLVGGDVCGFVFVGGGVVGSRGGGGGRQRVHLVDHSTEILIPRLFQPQPPPTQALDDCCVIEVGDMVVPSNSTAQRQKGSCYLPPH